MSFPRTRPLLFVLLALAITGLAACGAGDDKPDAAQAKSRDKAFLTSMLHHHGTAIEMAEIARKRGKDPFVKNLAEDIVNTQTLEMNTMRVIGQRMFGTALKPNPMGHDGLGLSAEEAGMTHTPETNEMLRAANPFDRAFVDEMVPHHRGATRMAETVLRSTKDAEVRKLAQGIVSTQKREVEEMNAFRQRTYGGPVPDKKGGGGGEHGGGHSG